MPLIVNLCDAGNIIINGHGVVGIVDHKAGLAAAGFFNVFLFRIIHFYFTLAPSLGIIGGKSCSLLKGGIRERGPF